MNKPSMLAAAVAVSLVTSAQAAKIHDQDGTRVDVYGRLQTEFYHNGNIGEIKDSGTRIGFRTSHQQSENLQVFANLEFRFEADERRNRELQARESYFGVQGNWGKLWLGNFNGIYYNHASGRIALDENIAVDYTGAGHNANGDTLAYEFQSGGLLLSVAAKHFSGKDNNDKPADAFNLQAVATYQLGDLNLVLALDQQQDADVINNDRHGYGSGNPRIGLGGTLKVNALTASALAEIEDGEVRYALAGQYQLGSVNLYGAFSLTSEDFEGQGSYKDLQSALLLGSNWRFSKPAYAYAEFTTGDKFDADASGGKYDNYTLTLGTRYNW